MIWLLLAIAFGFGAIVGFLLYAFCNSSATADLHHDLNLARYELKVWQQIATDRGRSRHPSTWKDTS